MSLRPKPWEKSGSTNSDPVVSMPQNTGANASSKLAVSGGRSTEEVSDGLPGPSVSSGVPALPERPTGNVMASGMPTASYSPYSGSYNGYGNYGGASYGGNLGGTYGTGYSGGGYGSYSSPYSRYGSGMYGGMGGMGGMGGYGGYGAYGSVGGPQDPSSFRGSLESSTTATFQLIESIVGAVGGFAQMLESTYMATHSSFFAMISVAEQFGHLKNSLGSILGIFAILRWSRKLMAKLTGKSTTEITAKDFAKFSKHLKDASPSSSPRPRPSFKPLLVFVAAVFGFPYLLGKLIRAMAAQQESNMKHLGPPGLGMDPNQEMPIDPSTLQFCKALYDFIPENPHVELELHKGDLVAILSTQDINGKPSQWWRARSRDGRKGYIPSTYVQVVTTQPRIKEEPESLVEEGSAKS